MQIFHNVSLKSVIFTINFISICILTVGTAYSTSTPGSDRTIVVDPGHGGFETGANGADGTLEKNITLVCAKQIKARLGKKYNVVLTRTDDYWVDTRQRAEIANSAKAELLISLHTNGSYVRETQGVSIIYYAPPATDQQPSVKNLPVEWYRTQEKFIPLSRLLAKSLFKRLSSNPNHNTLRINSLPMSSLSGANMPAILIEIGYLTNPVEERQLNNSDFLSDYVKEICTEIESFLENHPIIY